MRAYHIDLRDRVVAAYLRGEGSYAEVAARYEIARNSVVNWVHLYRSTGRAAPRPHGGGVPATLSGDRLHTLCQLVGERPDATLAEYHQAIEQECQIETSRSAVSRALARAKLTRKRRRSMRTNGIAPTSSRTGPRSAWSKPTSTRTG